MWSKQFFVTKSSSEKTLNWWNEALFLWFHRREQHFIALVYCTQVSIYWEILLAVSKLRSKVGKNFLGLAWEKVRSIFKWQSNSFEIHILDLWIWVAQILKLFSKNLAYFICSLDNLKKFLCRYFLVKLEVLCLLFMKVFPDSKFCKCQKIFKTTILILFTEFWIWKHFHKK